MQQKIDTTGASPLVNLHIAGVQKAGTSALAHFLMQHPDICLVKGKEAHVFDDPDFVSTDDSNEFAETKYAAKLAHYNKEKYICDATPITLFHPVFIQRCIDYNPHARFIVLLRDPIERAISHFKMTKARGLESRNIASAFFAEPVRMIGWRKHLPDVPFQHPYRDQSYLLRGRYRQQLNALYQYVPPSNVLILQQTDLLREHQAVLDRVTDFLGIARFEVAREKVFATTATNRLPFEKCARAFARCFFWLNR